MYEQALKIHRLFHKMAQANRAIGNSLPGGLSLAQNQLLVELDADKDRSLRDLEHLLKLDQSSISRLSAGLETRGLIKRTPDPEDGRRYRLELTAAGRNSISATDRFADKRLEEFCSALSADEARRLGKYFKLLGDGMGESSGIPRPHEHPLRAEQRRLARAVGLLSDSYMQSGLAVSYWYLLSEVCTNRDSLDIKSLSERLGLAKNSVSTLVSVLQRKGFIQKRSSESDARSVFVTATNKGRQLFQELEEKAAQLIESGLKSFSKAEANELAELLRRFVSAGDRSLAQLLLDGKFSLARSVSERAKARSFLVLEGLRSEDSLYLPDTLFGEQYTNIIFSVKNGIKAAFQFERLSSRWRLTCAGWLKSLEQHLPELLLQAANFAQIEKFEIDYPPLARFADDIHLPKGLVVNL